MLLHYPLEQIASQHRIQPTSECGVLTLLEPDCINTGKLADKRKYRNVSKTTLAIS